MSSDFWINLLLALLVFGIALLVINRSKFRFIRRLMADGLRRKLTPKLQAILPVVVAELQAEQPNLFPLFRLRADLEALSSRAGVLFEVEQLALTDFLARLSKVIAKHESGVLGADGLDDVVLSGQRAINELNELSR